LDALFSLYDRDNSGYLDYKEFITALYNRDPSANGKATNSPARSTAGGVT